MLKIKLADLRRELHVLRTGVANVDVLKREVSGMQLLLWLQSTQRQFSSSLNCRNVLYVQRHVLRQSHP